MVDVVIVGGGVIGLLSARELSLRGASVCVIERGQLGGESSWAGGGIISPLYPWRYHASVNVLAQRSKQIYPSLVPALIDESGVDAELLHSGMLIVDDDEKHAAVSWANKYQEQLECLDTAQQINSVCTSVATGHEHALWMPNVMQVRNPLLVKALKGSCEKLGIETREHCEILDIHVEQGQAKGVVSADGLIAADKVVVASGAWTGKLLQQRAKVNVEPVKGQMVMMKTAPGSVDRIIMNRGHYVIPRQDGHVLAGSTLEFSGFDKNVTTNARQELYRDACALVPSLAEAEVIRHWAGLRPGTEQGIPYICEHDEIANLYIHAGHYRNGIVLGAASAELLAQMISAEQTFCDVAAYRFGAAH